MLLLKVAINPVYIFHFFFPAKVAVWKNTANITILYIQHAGSSMNELLDGVDVHIVNILAEPCRWVHPELVWRRNYVGGCIIRKVL